MTSIFVAMMILGLISLTVLSCAHSVEAYFLCQRPIEYTAPPAAERTQGAQLLRIP